MSGGSGTVGTSGGPRRRTGPATRHTTTGDAAAPGRGPGSLTVSTSGWAVLAAAAVGVVLGLVLGWTEFLVIGLAATVVALVAAVSLTGRSSGEVELAVLEREVVAGGTATVVLRVNAGGAARRAVDAELVVGDRVEAVRLPAAERGSSKEISIGVPAERRGVVRLGPVTQVRRDPLGLVSRESVRSGTRQLFVHPPTAALTVATSGLLRDLEGVPTTDLADSDIAFQSLRPYVSGDDRRHIHWKSTAKTGSFLVRQFEQTRRSHLVVLQSLSADEYAGPEEFELAVSVVASIGVRAIADATALSVYATTATVPGERGRLRSRGRRELLDDLSGIERFDDAPGVMRLARVVAEQAPDASLVFVVCGSPVSARRLRAAAANFGPAVTVVAVVVDPEAQPTVVRVDTLRIMRIGYLDDLVRGLARTVGA